jgi:hypothetical protein
MTERVITQDLLMVLFNELHSQGKGSFSVKYPFYDVNLFDFSLDFKIRNVIGKEKLQNIRSEHMPDSNFLIADLPSYQDLESTFLSCGVHDYANWDEFSKWISDLMGGSKDPRRMASSLCFAIDTNILYNRFFTGTLPSKDLGFDAEDLEIVISDLVRTEVSSRIKYKYRSGNLVKMRKSFKNRRYLDEFANRNMLMTRKAKLAQQELDYFTRELSAHGADPTTIPQDKEQMDIEIVKSYKAFGQQCGMTIALITMDQNMADHAKNHSLMYHTLVYPKTEFRRGPVNPWCSLQMFHDLAVKFGVLALSGTGVVIFGEWKGKTSQDYTDGKIKLLMDDNSSIHDRLVSDLDLCEKILNV